MKVRLLFVFIFFITIIKAQTPIIFETSKTQSFLISHSSASNESQRVLNDMIEVIAKFMRKPPTNVKISFSCKENIKITKSRDKIHILVYYDDIRIGGDALYKSFDIADEFIPEKYYFKGVLKRKNGQELKNFFISETSFSPQKNEAKFEYKDTIQSEDYQFIISERNFVYDRKSFRNLKNKTQIIDQYYNADIDLNVIYTNLQNVNTQNFEQIGIIQQNIDIAADRYYQIDRAEFWKLLDINGNDPINLKMKMVDVQKTIQDKQNETNYTKSIIHKLYFEKGVSELQNRKRNNARNNFRQSINFSSTYPYPYYYLALMAYQDNDIEESMKILNDFYALNQIDNDLLIDASYLSKDVENIKIQQVRREIYSYLFQDALNNIDKIENFCKKIPNYNCNDSLNILRKECHISIYNQYIDNADCDFKMIKFNDSYTQIDKAINYQQKYKDYILSNNEALILKQKVKAEHYLWLMKNGKMEYNKKNFLIAFAHFFDANEIEKDYNVKKDKLLPDLLKKSKLELLLIDASQTENMVKSNNLTQARNNLLEIISDQKRYNLVDNKILNAKIDNLRNSIFSKQCQNAQNEYNIKLNEASLNLQIKNYPEAINKYNQAIEISNSNNDCQLNIDDAKKGITNYQAASVFQKDLEVCNSYVSKGNYQQAISKYKEIIQHYNLNKLDTLKLEIQPMNIYISEKGIGFMEFATAYFIEKEQFIDSFYLLKELKIRKFKRSKTKNIQKAIAQNFAIIDYKADSNVNYELKIGEYTQNDSWFKYFNSEYKSKIKKLKK